MKSKISTLILITMLLGLNNIPVYSQLGNVLKKIEEKAQKTKESIEKSLSTNSKNNNSSNKNTYKKPPSCATGNCVNGNGIFWDEKTGFIHRGQFINGKQVNGTVQISGKNHFYIGSFVDGEIEGKNIAVYQHRGIALLEYPKPDINIDHTLLYSSEFVKGKQLNNLGTYFFQNFNNREGDYTNFPFNNLNSSYYGQLNDDGIPNGYGVIYFGKEFEDLNGKIKFDSAYFENGIPISAKKYYLYSSKNQFKTYYNVAFDQNQKTYELDRINHFSFTETPKSTKAKVATGQKQKNHFYYDRVLDAQVHDTLSRYIDSVYYTYFNQNRQKLIYKEIYSKIDTTYYKVFGKRYYPYEDSHLFDAFIIYNTNTESNKVSKPKIVVKPQFDINFSKNKSISSQFSLPNYNPFLDKSIPKNDDFYKKINRILNNASRSNKYKDTYDIIKLVDSKYSWVYQNKYENIVSSKTLPFRYVVAETKPNLNCKSELKYAGRTGGEDPTIKTTTTKGEYLGNDSNGKGVYTDDKTETNFSLGSLGNETFKFLCNCNSEPPSKSIATVWKGYNYHVMGVEGIEWESEEKIVNGLEVIYKERKWNFITKKELDLKTLEAEKHYKAALNFIKIKDFEKALKSLNDAAKLIPYGKYYSSLNDLLSETKKYEVEKTIAFIE